MNSFPEESHAAIRTAILFICLLCLSPVLSDAGEEPRRIVSLAPSTTEILFALGLGNSIVGVTTFCDYPPEARTKPRIGGMSNPSLEAVVSLKPDIVVLTTDGNPKKFEERLRSLNIRTYVYKSRRLSDLPQGIREMGSALGVQKEAELLSQSLETKLDEFRSFNRSAKKTKVLFVVWPKPLVVAGPRTVIHDAIELLGAENIAADAHSNYPKYSVEEILNRSPDIIFIGSMNQNMKEVSEDFLKKLKNIEAVKHNRVYFVGDLLYRLGPRAVQGLEELAGYLDL